MKRLRRLLTLLFVFAQLLPVISYAGTIDAAEGSLGGILSAEIAGEKTQYAYSVFSCHVSALISGGELEGSVGDYTLGTSFTVTDLETEEYCAFFPVLYDDDMVMLLMVTENDGELGASLSYFFVDELKALLTLHPSTAYTLLSDGLNIFAYDGSAYEKMYELYANDLDETTAEELSPSVAISSTKDDMHLVTLDDMATISTVYSVDGSVPQITIVASKTLSVTGVSQGSYDWCWAATCAALINYYKNKSLAARDIVVSIYGSSVNKSGGWTEIQRAYIYYGLSPTQTNSIVSYSTVVSNIKNNKPLHIRLSTSSSDTGHSVGLIGYETCVDSASNDIHIMVLLEPNGGVQKTVTLNSNGNFSYTLGGNSYSWARTITF